MQPGLGHALPTAAQPELFVDDVSVFGLIIPCVCVPCLITVFLTNAHSQYTSETGCDSDVAKYEAYLNDFCMVGEYEADTPTLEYSSLYSMPFGSGYLSDDCTGNATFTEYLDEVCINGADLRYERIMHGDDDYTLSMESSLESIENDGEKARYCRNNNNF